MTNAHTPLHIMVAPQNTIKQCVDILIVSADSLILSASILIAFAAIIEKDAFFSKQKIRNT